MARVEAPIASDSSPQRHSRAATARPLRRGSAVTADPSSPTTPARASSSAFIAAWLAAGPDTAAVSHESALELLDLSDVVPSSVHIAVPRSRRGYGPPPGVTLHTTTRALGPSDVTVRNGMRVTAPTRSIVDAAEAGVAPEQIRRGGRGHPTRPLGPAGPDRGRTQARRTRAGARGGRRAPGRAAVKYPTAAPFRQALEARLQNEAARRGTSIVRLRKLVASDRLPARPPTEGTRSRSV